MTSFRGPCHKIQSPQLSLTKNKIIIKMMSHLIKKSNYRVRRSYLFQEMSSLETKVGTKIVIIFCKN